MRAEIDEERIDLAIVVVVGKAGAARNGALLSTGPAWRDTSSNLSVAEAAKERVLLRDEMDEAAVEDEDVEEAVVIEVVDAGSPTDVLRIGLRHAVGGADVVEAESRLRPAMYYADSGCSGHR